MIRNYHHTIKATLYNSKERISDYEHRFEHLKTTFNDHSVPTNPIEIDSISLSDSDDNIVIFDFWSENELPVSRELQSMRRVSEELAALEPSVVKNSHVFISVA